jgi:hypothetical protein
MMSHEIFIVYVSDIKIYNNGNDFMWWKCMSRGNKSQTPNNTNYTSHEYMA